MRDGFRQAEGKWSAEDGEIRKDASSEEETGEKKSDAVGQIASVVQRQTCSYAITKEIPSRLEEEGRGRCAIARIFGKDGSRVRASRGHDIYSVERVQFFRKI